MERLSKYAAERSDGDLKKLERCTMIVVIGCVVAPMIIGAVFCGIYFHMWTETWSYNDDYASSIGVDSDKNYYDLCEEADLNAASTIGVGSISDSVG